MEQQSPGFDLRYFLHTLYNGRWIILATSLIAMTLAIISNHFQAFKYQSWAQVQIDPPPSLSSPGTDILAQNNYYLSIDRYFKSEKEKMSSPRMYHRFAERMGERYPQYRAKPREGIVAELGKGLLVEPVPDTNLVSVSLTLDNPQKAAEWLNLYVDLFVEENARQQEENVKQNREILRKQLDEIKSLIASQQGQMSDYVASIGMAGGPEGASALDSEFVFRYQQNYDEARRKRVEHEERLAKLAPFLAEGADLSGLPIFDFAPGLRGNYDRYVEAQSQLEKLRADGKGDLHPQVVARRADRENSREQLRAELKKSADGLKMDLSIARNAESAALKAYNEKLSERRMGNRQAQEMARLSKMRDTWTNASALVEDRLRSLKLLESFVSNNMRVVERAQPPMYPVSQRGKTFVVLVAIGGFLIGCGIVVAGELLNPKVKTVEEIHSSFNVPALGFLPRAADFSLGQIRESYNVLRTELLFRRDTHQHKVVMVTSSLPQEGKTTVTLNLAKTLAAAGERTVVLDFDLRKARLRSIMSTGSQNGKSVFSPVDGLNLRLEKTDTQTLHLIVPATLPQQPPFLLSQPEIKELIEYLRSKYDWVLIDTPPVTSVTDPVIVAAVVDTVLFIIKHNFVDKRLVRNSLAALSKANADIMGAVLNDLDVRKMNYYSYQSYYRYYSDSESK